jgi:threonine synthase
MLGGCPDCVGKGQPGILDPVYDGLTAEMLATEPLSLWDAHHTLPLPDSTFLTTLGEGGTPLLPISPATGNWWVKFEAVNPTHSYKDRTNTVAVSVARYFGRDSLVCTSTGNHGVALTAYAAKAGTRCVVLMPPEAPPLSLQEMRFFGAEVVIVEDGNFVSLLESMVLERGWYVSQRNAPGVGTRRIGNPYGMEGYKTISYEIFHQLGKRAPDRVFLPVGGGDAAWGVHKGFAELAMVGLIERAPQIVACQSAAGAPLVNAVEKGLDQVAPVETSPTIAYSIVERQTGDLALRAIRESGGTAVSVTDEEIRAAACRYAAMGVCLESSSSAALAGAEKLGREGQLDPSETIVTIGTGAGLRWPETFVTRDDSPPRIDGTIEALNQVFSV